MLVKREGPRFGIFRGGEISFFLNVPGGSTTATGIGSVLAPIKRQDDRCGGPVF